MGSDKLELSEIVELVSKQTGAVVGTSVAVTKKVADSGVRGAAAVKNLLTRPFRKSVLESDRAAVRRKLEETRSKAEKTQSQLASQLRVLQAEKDSLISDLDGARREANEIRAQEDTVRAQVATLESDLTVVRHELEKARSEEKDAKSQLSSDVSAVRTEAETVLSKRGQEKVAVMSAEDQVESSMEATAAQPDEEISVGVAEIEAPTFLDVTLREAHEAVFPNVADRVIFTRALSDITSQDPGVRADAARVIAGIHHELSVRTLIARMAREPSSRVRQECVKALTRLKMKEGLGAVKRALTDEAASVRLAAVWALYHLGGAESAPELAHMFSDEDEEIRRRAAMCSGWLGQEKLAAKLLPLLADSSVSVRQAAIEAMANLRSRQVVSTLIEHLDDPEKTIRKAIIGALRAITGKKMNGAFPTDEKSLQLLMVRWHEWWREELLG